MSYSNALFEPEKQEAAYTRLKEWFQPQARYAEFVAQNDEVAKRLLLQFVQLEQRRSSLSDEDVSFLAFGAIEILEDAFAGAKPQFLGRWGRIYRDFYDAKWKMGDLQGMVASYLADRLSGRAQCLWNLSMYHYLAEGVLRHLMLALWLTWQTGRKRSVGRYRIYAKQDPAELISLFVNEHNWARVLNSLYEKDLRIAFAHIQYQMGKQPETICLKLCGEDVELDSSGLATRVLGLLDGVTSLGFGVEAFFLRNHDSFHVASLGLQIDPAQYLNQIQILMAVRGFRFQAQLRQEATRDIEILALLAPMQEGILDADVEQFAKDSVAEIVCYLDHYTSFHANNIRLVLMSKDGRRIGESHIGPEELKKIRESARTFVE